MYTIAVCDDEKKEINNIVKLLKKFSKNNELNFKIETFLSSNELFCYIREGNIPDILFLDIYMEHENGIP